MKKGIVSIYYILSIALGFMAVVGSLFLSQSLQTDATSEMGNYLARNVLEKIHHDIIEIEALAERGEINNITKKMHIAKRLGDNIYYIKASNQTISVNIPGKKMVMQSKKMLWNQSYDGTYSDMEIYGRVSSASGIVVIKYSEVDNPTRIFIENG